MLKRKISTRGILEKVVTLYVDDTTKAILDAGVNPQNGQVIIPEGGYAVTLTADETVGFGSSANGTANDYLFGIIKTYSGTNTVGVQIQGFCNNLNAKAAIDISKTSLVATNDGKVASVDGATGRAIVTKASKADNLMCNVYFN